MIGRSCPQCSRDVPARPRYRNLIVPHVNPQNRPCLPGATSLLRDNPQALVESHDNCQMEELWDL